MALLICAALGGCAGSPGSEDELTVFAAASLTDAFAEIGEAYEEEHESVTVAFNFAGSQALATQIIEGGSANLFAAADVEQMQRVAGEGRIDGDWTIFALNRLVVIVPSDNPADIQTIEDLAQPGVKLVLAAEEVPAGRYSREMLARVAASPEAGADFAQRVESNIVSNEGNVRQVAAKVQLGEADAGIVYASDVSAAMNEDVAVIEIPEERNVIAEYPIAVVEDASGGAEDFVAFVLSPAGSSILKEHGFVAPGQ